MLRFAKHLALYFDAPCTRHSYYRQIRLIHEWCQCDHDTITEERLRDYFPYLKTVKAWKSKTIPHSAAAAKLFFVGILENQDWKFFSQIRTKDDSSLPAVLTREEVISVLRHIRLRRSRIPIKLVYCCGLRLSACPSLTIHDIDSSGSNLWIHEGKGKKDRMISISRTMVEDLR